MRVEKRYQVFISSTFADLQDERRRVIQTLMEMDCIPSGMELFPAADEEQWSFIRRVIDDCDYYLLIIGGRYGSVTAEGISYTEKEYDYAIEKGIRVIALMHADPDSIPLAKSEIEPDARAKLVAFREKVRTGRLVKAWVKADELPGLVALSLSKTIKTHPAVGWVRGDQTTTAEVLSEINQVRKENAQLREVIAKQQPAAIDIADLADLDDKTTIHGEHWLRDDKYAWAVELTWRHVFSLIAPYLHKVPNDDAVKSVVTESVHRLAKNNHGYPVSLDDQDFQTLRVQLVALRLITTSYSKTTGGGMALFWSLTPKGEALLFETRTIRKPKP